jgi:hypothetical protein
VAGALANSNYEPELPQPDAGSAPATGPQRVPGAKGARPAPDVPAWSPDLAQVHDFLQLLARAVRQLHTYPPTSPLCVDAIAACHHSLASLQVRDAVVARITPRELVVDDTGLGAGTVIEHELVRRLHRVRVASVKIDRDASLRDLSRFCEDVSRCDDYARKDLTLAEVLVEHGVDRIDLRMAHRPEVLEVGAPRTPLCDLVESERRRHNAAPPADGPVNHLYPPDKGWVRLDPAATFDTVSLIDLTVLVEDPSQIATMLLRLTDDEPVGPEGHERALEQKFSDVAMLFSALDPRLARMMFAKMARAVLDLEPERRINLLKRTILPGLLDGRADGDVLRDFPDIDLAESLFLLLDLETAAPEMLTTALNRLDLPTERRESVVPLLEKRLRGEAPASGASESGIDRYARKLIRVEPTSAKNFAEFAAFDLSMDDHATAALASVRGAMSTTDVVIAQLRCLSSLVRIEPNPTITEALLGRATALLGELERAARWQDLGGEIAAYRQMAGALAEPRPDVAEAIAKMLAAFCTPERAARVAELYFRDAEGKAIADTFMMSYGAAIAPALLALLETMPAETKTRTIGPLMCQYAALLAPAIVPNMAQSGPASARIILRMLGFAGPGFEAAIAEHLGRGDEQTDREGLRALARIGTSRAATIVANELRHGTAGRRAAAEEALWHLPPAHAAAQLREILGSRDFVVRNPQVALRLLERAGQAAADGLGLALAALVPLRFRFWNPPVVRVAKKARELLGVRLKPDTTGR